MTMIMEGRRDQTTLAAVVAVVRVCFPKKTCIYTNRVQIRLPRIALACGVPMASPLKLVHQIGTPPSYRIQGI
jgi:hypothetical protein